MKTAKQFRQVIRDAAAYAREQEPADVDARVNAFACYMTGRLERDEPAIAVVLHQMLDLPKPSTADGA